MNKIIEIVLNDNVSQEDTDNLADEIANLLEYHMLIGSVKVSERNLEGECDDA